MNFLSSISFNVKSIETGGYGVQNEFLMISQFIFKSFFFIIYSLRNLIDYFQIILKNWLTVWVPLAAYEKENGKRLYWINHAFKYCVKTQFDFFSTRILQINMKKRLTLFHEIYLLKNLQKHMISFKFESVTCYIIYFHISKISTFIKYIWLEDIPQV